MWITTAPALAYHRCLVDPYRRSSSRHESTLRGGINVTLIWFVVWLVFDLVGDRESLTFDPPNWWAGTLLLAAALDLGRQHASPLGRNR
jgi:hypothetical protein